MFEGSISSLAAIPLFKPLSERGLTTLSKACRKKIYKKGSLLQSMGQKAQNLYYIGAGWVMLFKESCDGDQVVLDVLPKAHYFGEEYLMGNQLSNYSAKTIADATIYQFPLTTINTLLAEEPAFTLHLLEETLRKKQGLGMAIEQLSSHKAIQRVGCFILRLCDPMKNSATVTLPYNKVLLASRLGIRAETFSRSLDKLRQSCGLRIEGECLHVPDIQQLAQEVCAHCSQSYPCEDRSMTTF